MKPNPHSPIGIFDSGIGGVSTLGQAVYMLPNEDYIYYGDNGNGPYSLKSKQEVREYCFNACDFLIEKGVKAIVVACNTATGIAIADLRARYALPILGMEPAVKVAIGFNLPGKIVVTGTGMTLKSQALADLITKYANGADLVKLPLRDVIIMIEKGIIDGPEMEACLKEYFKDLSPEDISCIVFGCTHFGVLEPPIKNIMGRHVKIADGNEGTIRHLGNILKTSNLLNPGNGQPGNIEFYNSGEAVSLENSKKNFEQHLHNLKKG